ncbi:glycosyltransferase family 4 protein [Bacteroidales bacterium OttesenSCG-928-I14]|nr:glycosyltransferase family 4 protein [Bacteroidales bacterium OttesenSCG-928-I14]
MKVVHAIYSLITGGTENMLIDIVNQQCQYADVHLIIINDIVNDEYIKNIDKRVNIFRLNRIEGSKYQLLSSWIRIDKFLRSIKPDVIHCHNHNIIPFFLLWRKITCLTVHCLNIPTKYLKYYNKIFSISKAVQDDLIKRANIKSILIYNGILLDDFQRKNNYSEIELESFYIIQVGRLFYQTKGQDIAIRALSLLVKKYTNLHINLSFAGEGNDLEILQFLAKELNLENNITFLGNMKKDWISTNLSNYHLLIQPSREEGFGLTIIEGFASGIPVIASKAGGLYEILHILNSGISINPDSCDDLADAISMVIDAYVNNKIKDTDFLIKENSKLSLFDVKTTAKKYIDNY